MGGEGVRFEHSIPKQLHNIGGKPIFLHTLEHFLRLDGLDKIILPTAINWHQEVLQIIAHLPQKEKIEIIKGGPTRQISSYLGLLACDVDTDYVIIHDAVRPFVSSQILKNNLEQVFIHKAVDTCIPSTDTIVQSGSGNWIESIPNRKDFLRGQTPQSFSFPLILQAHKTALCQQIENSSDDCTLVQRLGHPIKIVLGSEKNIKITTELDLFLAEQILHRSFEETILYPSEELRGKIFAITGATGGIGQAICSQLANHGAIIISISKTAGLFQADLTKSEETAEIFRRIHEQYGPIDGLINSIGSFFVKDFSLLSPEEITDTIHSNLTSLLYCCKYAKLKTGGHIINISSSSYSRGRKDYPVYSASKAAVVNFTQGLAESRPDLYINVVVPQRTNTALRKMNFPAEDVSNLLQPEEIAEKIAKLLQTNSITGTIIEVRKKT